MVLATNTKASDRRELASSKVSMNSSAGSLSPLLTNAFCCSTSQNSEELVHLAKKPAADPVELSTQPRRQ